jgi:polyphosphate kinase
VTRANDAQSGRYFDRELSWIDFNARVLAEAAREDLPLLERLKFMGIVSSNFDEFFMVRVAGLNDYDPDLEEIYRRSYALMDRQTDEFLRVIVPGLRKAGIVRVLPQEMDERQQKHVEGLFARELMPLLTPVAVGAGRPMPALANLGLYVIVRISENEKPGQTHEAVIEIPRKYPRMISLPAEQGYAFVLLEDVVMMMARELFRGFRVEQSGLFRVVRAAEMTLDEEKDEDFAKVMTEALRVRRKNFIARLDAAVPEDMIPLLSEKLKVPAGKIYRQRGWFDLKTVAQIAFPPAFEDLRRPEWIPRVHPDFEQADDLWALLREKDVLIHHPYESFDAVLRFLSTAAQDPDVLAIKQTLYRFGDFSPVIPILEMAVERGKQVTVLVELKARFDEACNISGAERLVQAGVTVLYGVAGLKTHAKACLVVRREPEGIRRYLHLGTGNYNDKTAALYSDLGYFTAREELTKDIAEFFNIITGYSHPAGFARIDIAPYTLRTKLRRLIQRETMRSRKSEPGLILAKMNSLVDPGMIELLYQASQAGVKIKLNVRGVCCLKPGVPGLSETIEVVSLVDMFLEHSRIFYFHNGGDEEVYLSSADWMPRNLDTRLEVMFPVEDMRHKKTLAELLSLYFKDNTQSWVLQSSGEYVRNEPREEKKARVQEILCRKAAESSVRGSKAPWARELKPQRPKS